MDKFVWEEPLDISNSVCDGCMYRHSNEGIACDKYEQIPQAILENKNSCKYYDYPERIHLD